MENYTNNSYIEGFRKTQANSSNYYTQFRHEMNERPTSRFIQYSTKAWDPCTYPLVEYRPANCKNFTDEVLSNPPQSISLNQTENNVTRNSHILGVFKLLTAISLSNISTESIQNQTP